MTYTNEELIELFRDDYSNSTKDVSMKTVELYITNVKYLLDFLHNKPILDLQKMMCWIILIIFAKVIYLRVHIIIEYSRHAHSLMY